MCFIIPSQELLLCLPTSGHDVLIKMLGYICRCPCGRCLETGFYLPSLFSYPSFVIEFQVLSSLRSKPMSIPVAYSTLIVLVFSAAFDFFDNSNLENPSLMLCISLHHPGWSHPSGLSSHLALPAPNHGHSWGSIFGSLILFICTFPFGFLRT